MSLVKTAIAFDGTDVIASPGQKRHLLDTNHVMDMNDDHDFEVSIPDLVIDSETFDDGDVVEFDIEEDSEGNLVLTLDKVPGGDDQEEIEIEEPTDIEVEPDEDVEVTHDPWAWDLTSFLPWLSDKMQTIPRHSGRDTAGLERAIAYLEKLDKEISKAVRSDLDNQIAIDSVEKARDEIKNGVERLQDRLEKINTTKYKKNKKKAEYDEEGGFIKEAKSTHVGGIVVTVPLLISSLARTCINSVVSAGHDIEKVFVKLAKEYDLTSREKLEMFQLLSDMGYPIRTDLGMINHEIDPTSADNVNWAQQFYS